MPRIITDGQPAGAGGGVATGDVSVAVEFSSDISGVNAPTAGTVSGTAIPTLDHDGALTTEEGQQVDFKVPDDYDSGDLVLKITYAMSSSSSNNIRISTKAVIADVTGNSIDSSTYPKTWQTFSPHDTQDEPARASVLTISSGDFGAGDTIQFQVTRNPGDGLDTHTGDWQVISYEISYTGQVATRNTVQQIELFQDTDETAPASGTLSSFTTLDYSASADNEQKFQCIVPENWDGFSDLSVRLTYALSAGTGGVVVLETEGDIADVSANSTTSIAAAKIHLPVAADTDPHRSTIIRSIPAGDLGVGDSIVLKVARRAGTDSADTANSDLFKVVNATVITGVAPSAGFESIVREEHYLFAHDFEVQAGSPSGELESPDFAGDFETWLKMTGNGSSEQIDVSFQGRLMSTQSAIKSIKVPMKASTTGLTYNLKVYVEDGSASTPAYASGDTAPGGTSRFVLSLTDGDLSSRQPDFTSGREGRFFVVVEAKLDSAEILRVGRPFVGLE